MGLDRDTPVTKAIREEIMQISDQLVGVDRKLTEIISLLRKLVQK